MNLVETITQPSQALISTLGGQIQIDEGRGLMRISDPSTGVDLVKIDRSGFLFNDGTRRRILLGKYGLEVGFWLSPPDKDVIDLLEA